MKVILSTSGCSTSAAPAVLPKPGTTLSTPAGNPGLERQLADPQRGERRELGRLQHHGASAGQRRRDFPHADHQREIPGNDGADHAYRFAHRVGERIDPRRNDLPVDLVRPAGVVSQRVEHGGQVLPANGGNRFAGIQALERDERVLVLPDEVRQTQQKLPPVGSAHAAPFALECLPRRRDGRIDVGGVAFGDLRNHPLPWRGRESRSTCPIRPRLAVRR